MINDILKVNWQSFAHSESVALTVADRFWDDQITFSTSWKIVDDDQFCHMFILQYNKIQEQII